MLRASDKRLHIGEYLKDVLPARRNPFVGCTLVSDFSGTENPLSEGGNWADLDGSTSNQLAKSAGVGYCTGSATGDRYWTPATFGPDCEAFVTISTLPAVATDQFNLLMRVINPGGTTFSGYAVAIQGNGLVAINCNRASGTPVQLAATSTGVFSAGNKMGIRVVGSTIEAWIYTTGWKQVLTTYDVGLSAAGNLAMRLRGTTGRFDDMYAATI